VGTNTKAINIKAIVGDLILPGHLAAEVPISENTRVKGVAIKTGAARARVEAEKVEVAVRLAGPGLINRCRKI